MARSNLVETTLKVISTFPVFSVHLSLMAIFKCYCAYGARYKIDRFHR